MTSQLYFPDGTSDAVLTQASYVTRPGRDTTNDTDEIFATGGDPAVLDIVPTGAGYRAAICFELPDPDDASRLASPRRASPPRAVVRRDRDLRPFVGGP